MPTSTKRLSVLSIVCIASLFAATALSCSSVPKDIPEGLSPAEMVQKAQDLYDQDEYDGAARYYQTMKERFPQDLAVQCQADYEISFIRYKQKRYSEAAAGFKMLLERYKSTDAALLPTQYKVLGEKILSKIELQKTK